MGKRKGKIVMDFVSLEELQRLLDIMTGAGEGSRAAVAGVDN
jgi:hypothetical protein